jgi:hypothetical protein
MYKVLHLFADLTDKNHVYNPGDVYPRKGIDVSDERIAELSGSNNKQGIPLIEKMPETPEKKSAKKTKNTAEK